MKNALLAFFATLLALLALETGLRLAVPLLSTQPDPIKSERHLFDPYRGHRLNPDFATINNTGGETNHSADGFRRDAPVEIEKPVDTIRILMLGGSTLYGVGTYGGVYPEHRDLQNDQTISHHLEMLLNETLAHSGFAPIRVQVINAAVVGYQTFQHLVYLNSELLEYDPDLVINLDGHNDFYIVAPNHRHWLDYPYSSVQLTRLVNQRDPLIALHLLARSLASVSALGAQLEKRVTKPRFNSLSNQVGQPKVPESWIMQYPQVARRNFLRALWQINRLGEREGYDHLVFLQPEIVFEAPQQLSPHDRKILDITLKHNEPDYQQRFRTVRAMLPQLFAAERIPFVDLGRIGTDALSLSDLYIDYCHLTPTGSERLAALMTDTVLQRILPVAEKLCRDRKTPCAE